MEIKLAHAKRAKSYIKRRDLRSRYRDYNWDLKLELEQGCHSTASLIGEILPSKKKDTDSFQFIVMKFKPSHELMEKH